MVARYGTSLLVAAAVTFALFFIMQGLVVGAKMELSDIKSARFVDMVRVKREENVTKKEREVEKPPEVEAPPPQVDLPQDQDFNAKGEGLNFGDAGVSADVDLGGIGIGAVSDGEYLPIVKVAPVYPRRAAERGIEGSVLLEFTVTELGTVEDIVVIEANPPGYFERAATNAASKFKYKPKVVNGEPIPVAGVQNLITFELADDGRR